MRTLGLRDVGVGKKDNTTVYPWVTPWTASSEAVDGDFRSFLTLLESTGGRGLSRKEEPHSLFPREVTCSFLQLSKAGHHLPSAWRSQLPEDPSYSSHQAVVAVPEEAFLKADDNVNDCW